MRELTLRANGEPAPGATDQSELSMRVTVMGGWERPLDTIYRQSSLMPRSQLIDNSLENPTLSLLSQAHSMVVFCIHIHVMSVSVDNSVKILWFVHRPLNEYF